jgi:cell division septum initiation protein DivIVA
VFLNQAFEAKMEPEVKNFIDNVDAWIKQIRTEFSSFSDLPTVVNEATDNVQHNYELIYELRDQVDELKQEINALKLIQIISLKKTKKEKKLS